MYRRNKLILKAREQLLTHFFHIHIRFFATSIYVLLVFRTKGKKNQVTVVQKSTIPSSWITHQYRVSVVRMTRKNIKWLMFIPQRHFCLLNVRVKRFKLVLSRVALRDWRAVYLQKPARIHNGPLWSQYNLNTAPWLFNKDKGQMSTSLIIFGSADRTRRKSFVDTVENILPILCSSLCIA